MKAPRQTVAALAALASIAACESTHADSAASPTGTSPGPIPAVEVPTYGQPTPETEPAAEPADDQSAFGPGRAYLDPGADTPVLVAHAVAILSPTKESDAHGVVRFDVKGDALVATFDLEGVPPGDHAAHFHLFGDCSSADAKSAGTHFNLRGSSQSPPADIARITGNIGVLKVGKDGRADATLTVPGASLDGRYGVLGRSVVLHEKGNDKSKPPMGAAGSRLACGVVGVADDTLFAK